MSGPTTDESSGDRWPVVAAQLGVLLALVALLILASTGFDWPVSRWPVAVALAGCTAAVPVAGLVTACGSRLAALRRASVLTAGMPHLPSAAMRHPPRLILPGGVTLRPLRGSDVPAIVEQSRDRYTVKFTTVPKGYRPRDAHDYIASADEAWRDGSGIALAVERGGQFAGLVNMGIRNGVGSIGYAIHPRHRGNGLATAAVTGLLRWAFDNGVTEVTWAALCGNTASLKVARRCGFVPTGYCRSRQRGFDVLCWAARATPESFASRAAAAPLSAVSGVEPGTVSISPGAFR